MAKRKRISRAGFPGAATLERMARLGLTQLPKYVHGFKCWCGDARWIEDRAPAAFLTTNPTGGREAMFHDRDEGHLGAPYERRDPPWNAYLDERWPDRDPQTLHHKRVHRLYQSLFGSQWERALRATACFHVCGFRTVRAGDLPAELWTYSVDWMAKVLHSVGPGLILCDGNGPGRTPWAALRRAFGIGDVREWRIDPKAGNSRRVKFGTLKRNYLTTRKDLVGVRVLGVPAMGPSHASLWAGDPLRDRIREAAAHIPSSSPR